MMTFIYTWGRVIKNHQFISILISNDKMTAVRFHNCGDIRVDEVEEPLCGKDEVKVLNYEMKSKKKF